MRTDLGFDLRISGRRARIFGYGGVADGSDLDGSQREVWSAPS
jgi:hypothetical protein